MTRKTQHLNSISSQKPATRANPLQAAILAFASELSLLQRNDLQAPDIPKRYNIYGSLLLLGPTFQQHSPAWERFYNALTVQQKDELFKRVLDHFRGNVSHIAMNAPIALRIASDQAGVDVAQNVMRSPTGFYPLYGEFGPDQVAGKNISQPCQADLDSAYWTETVQLNNIVQVWAPRWTMFSRGNISEKSRILQQSVKTSAFPGLSAESLGDAIAQVDVVDFYVGIGYFAFCYLSRGVKRVWGWDLNGWSIEGLRRGCVKNGWGVKIVKIQTDGTFDDGMDIKLLVDEILRMEASEQPIRCIAFWGDNRWSATTMRAIQDCMVSKVESGGLNVRHCNLGLLPTSQPAWLSAIKALNPSTCGWLHIHENAEIGRIDETEARILRSLLGLLPHQDRGKWSATCEYVEQVKTYAPGVMHCVFDIKLCPTI